MAVGIPFDRDSLAKLPTKPGVYLFRDERGKVLYVGKAKSLRSRVRSYLSAAREASVKTRELVKQIDRVETLVVGSEAEALILEANLIKEHRPRFNIQLRDDKRYPYIKVTTREPFPRVYVTRRVIRDGSRYFGPFTSVGRMRQALDVVKRLYTVRSCRYKLPQESPSRPCLDYHIGRCQAPCVGLQSEEDYGAMIDEIIAVLSGDVSSIQSSVEVEMRQAAANMEFERAGRMRDVLTGLDAIANQQRVQTVEGGSRDIVGVARDGDGATAVTMKVREGLLIARKTHHMSGIEGEDDEALIERYAAHAYLSSGVEAVEELPREILVPTDFPDRILLEEILSQEAGRRIRVLVPQRGDKVRLIRLAQENARHALEERIRLGDSGGDRTEDVLFDLQERLGMKVVPRLVVCFDISHTQGAETVASAVLFENGEPKKSGYRHMKIKGSWGNDDYRSMHEAVGRYFSRRRESGEPLPDLAVIDGGKGQLSFAKAALEDLAITDVAMAALAKKEEIVFTPGRPEGIRIPRSNRALHFLQRTRDEAHRFAVSYNRKLRSKRTVRSALSDVPGIGPRRQQALLTRFGSVRGVREASPEEIARIDGFSKALAVRLLTYLESS